MDGSKPAIRRTHATCTKTYVEQIYRVKRTLRGSGLLTLLSLHNWTHSTGGVIGWKLRRRIRASGKTGKKMVAYHLNFPPRSKLTMMLGSIHRCYPTA